MASIADAENQSSCQMDDQLVDSLKTQLRFVKLGGVCAFLSLIASAASLVHSTLHSHEAANPSTQEGTSRLPALMAVPFDSRLFASEAGANSSEDHAEDLMEFTINRTAYAATTLRYDHGHETFQFAQSDDNGEHVIHVDIVATDSLHTDDVQGVSLGVSFSDRDLLVQIMVVCNASNPESSDIETDETCSVVMPNMHGEGRLRRRLQEDGKISVQVAPRRLAVFTGSATVWYVAAPVGWWMAEQTASWAYGNALDSAYNDGYWR